jgi:hypothetical protein
MAEEPEGRVGGSGWRRWWWWCGGEEECPVALAFYVVANTEEVGRNLLGSMNLLPPAPCLGRGDVLCWELEITGVSEQLMVFDANQVTVHVI